MQAPFPASEFGIPAGNGGGGMSNTTVFWTVAHFYARTNQDCVSLPFGFLISTQDSLEPACVVAAKCSHGVLGAVPNHNTTDVLSYIPTHEVFTPNRESGTPSDTSGPRPKMCDSHVTVCTPYLHRAGTPDSTHSPHHASFILCSGKQVSGWDPPNELSILRCATGTLRVAWAMPSTVLIRGSHDQNFVISKKHKNFLTA